MALKPIHYIEKLWDKEQFSKGCYACYFPCNGSFSNYGQFLRSRDEKVYRNLHWASTETSTEFYGYMEGAIRSGYRAANEIICDGNS